MKYKSTRGQDNDFSFEDVVIQGLASDGGLYIPHSVPVLPDGWDTKWSKLGFADLASEVMSLYIDPKEVSRDDLTTLCSKAFASFRHPVTTPIRQLSSNLFLLELFHGPTYAFKDVALQFLGHLFEYFLTRNATSGNGGVDHLTVVAATSGDTGR